MVSFAQIIDRSLAFVDGSCRLPPPKCRKKHLDYGVEPVSTSSGTNRDRRTEQTNRLFNFYKKTTVVSLGRILYPCVFFYKKTAVLVILLSHVFGGHLTASFEMDFPTKRLMQNVKFVGWSQKMHIHRWSAQCERDNRSYNTWTCGSYSANLQEIEVMPGL